MKNTRTIHTGFYTNKAKEVIDSVFGQLSDGMWENSRMAEKYWHFADTDVADDGEVVVNVSTDSSTSYCRDWVSNGFYDMTEKQVLEFIAKKMKAVAVQELKDEGVVKGWKRDNTEFETSYLSYYEKITIADVYFIYDALLGRKPKADRPDLIGAKRSTEEVKAARSARKKKADLDRLLRQELDEAEAAMKAEIKKIEETYYRKRQEIAAKYKDLTETAVQVKKLMNGDRDA